MKNPWRITKNYGEGILSDWGSHLFDQLVILIDSKTISIFSKLESRIWSKVETIKSIKE